MDKEQLWHKKITFTPIMSVQKRLDIKAYPIFKLFTKKYILSYGANDEFPFVERLNEITHWVHSAGLYDVWLAEEHELVVKDIIDNYLRLMESEKTKTIVEIERSPIPMFCCLWVVFGCSCFTRRNYVEAYFSFHQTKNSHEEWKANEYHELRTAHVKQ